MIDLGPLRLDLDRHRVRRPDGEASLTRLEAEALRLLLARAGAVVTREELEREVWGMSAHVRSEAVPVAMRRLRQKLGDGVVETVRGAGWRIAPPTRSAPRLPTFTTPFFGREAVLGEIAERLSGAWRVVTLRGPGGVGKTRAAVEFAARWPGEVVAVSLVGLPADGAALTVLLADALGLAGGDGAAVGRALAARDRALVLLDDADVVAAEIADAVTTLLHAAPAARLLVTSRVALGIPGEALVEVPPFSPEVARAFLVERLRGVHPDPAGEGAALDALVEALDGLPASLELYAARAWAGLGPLVAELRAGTQDATLDAQVRRSWDALGPEARDVLLGCAGFAGLFPPEAADAASGRRPALVAELRRRSLVQLDPRGSLFLLATVRRFCARQPGSEAARARAHAWVLDRAEAACAQLVREPARALEALGALRPHLVDIARTGAPLAAARAVVAASAGLAYTGPSALRLALLEGVDWAAAPGDLGERGRIELARARRMAGAPTAEVRRLVDDVRTAEGALARGDFAVAAGDREGALAAYAEVVALAPESELAHVLALARRSSPAALLTLRPPAELAADVARAEAACLRHGLAIALPEVLRAGAMVAAAAGEGPRARANLGRALQLAHAAGLTRQLGDLWSALGQAWYAESPSHAAACFERAVSHAEAHGDEALAAVFQLNLGMVRLVEDRPADALALLDAAARVLKSPVIVNLVALARGGALCALGRELEGRVALGAVDPLVVGALFSPDAARHGALLVRVMEAEGRLRALAEAPDAHAPALRALVADAAEEAARPGGGTIRAFVGRIERRLAAVS